MTDATNLIRLVQETQPDGDLQSGCPEPCSGQLRDRRSTPPTPTRWAPFVCWRRCDILARWRTRVRFYQASTSELYGDRRRRSPQNVRPPRSIRAAPTASAKLYAYWITVNYREAYGIPCLQRHPVQPREPDPRRDLRHPQDHPRGGGDPARAAATGSISAIWTRKRDWGHARDYVEGMWRILQQDAPGDYVLATGETRSVREFVEHAFGHVGREDRLARRRRGGTGDRQGDRRRVGGSRSALLPADRGGPAAAAIRRKARETFGWRHTRRRSPNWSPRWSTPISTPSGANRR